MPGTTTTHSLQAGILEAVNRIWGYPQLLPLQSEAILCGLSQRDSLVVLPTGGGKSLCYQVPPLVAGRTDVVISPLISLMKDQVDGLRALGYPAAALHSALETSERRLIRSSAEAGELRLLFVSPEGILAPAILGLVEKLNVRAFAIDEAHCISHWGHDFRPEYRRLAELRERFPEAGMHAFTATATPRVREDIVNQLGLKNPEILVGTFDRPNLTYRVLPRYDVNRQVLETIGRHENEAVIVYCLSRDDTEALAEVLCANQIQAAAYHAGLSDARRAATQEAFSREELNVVAATVAFGMGIDRSDVRCVIHAALPKSIEQYQQETGRAGRDGMPAECVLLYSNADFMRWQNILTRNGGPHPEEKEHLEASLELLRHMQGFCNSLQCRHRSLSRYFGQSYPKSDCEACDVCLGEVDCLDDSTSTAQKILSCVYRLRESFGVGYVSDVLAGSKRAEVRKRGHDRLSTHGLLSELPRDSIQNLIYQLLDQQFLQRSRSDRPVLQLTPEAAEVLRGQREVRLREPRSREVRRTRLELESWEGVDRGLFDHLRQLRLEQSRKLNIPPFLIFSDVTLREMARIRPTTTENLKRVFGIGDVKLREFGESYLAAVRDYCQRNNLSTDDFPSFQPKSIAPAKAASRPNLQKQRAFRMFQEGRRIEEVASAVGRARSTVLGYLVEWIEKYAPESIANWVDPNLHQTVLAAVKTVGGERLRPIFEALSEAVDYDTIRLVLTHRRALQNQDRHHSSGSASGSSK